MRRILLVDDELNVLSALQRELQDEYDIEAFSDPKEALQCCQKAGFDLVVADYKMPEMDGNEFLAYFSRLQPDAVSVMLSGEADFDAVVRAVNEAHIYRFISKPWSSTELAATIAEGLAYREQILENRRLAEVCRKQKPWVAACNPDKPYSILAVDNETASLDTLARDLAARGSYVDLHAALAGGGDQGARMPHRDFRFNVVTLSSPLEALERAKQANYDAVIAGYLMPEMNGLSFLEAFRELQPEAARILTSTHASKDELVKAINSLEIDAYLGKPWHEYTLRSIVSQAIARQELMRENRRLARQAGG